MRVKTSRFFARKMGQSHTSEFSVCTECRNVTSVKLKGPSNTNFVCIKSIQLYYFNTCGEHFLLQYPTKTQLQLIYKLSRSYMFRHNRVIFRGLVFITSPSFLSVSIAAVGNTVEVNKSHYNKISKTLNEIY